MERNVFTKPQKWIPENLKYSAKDFSTIEQQKLLNDG